MLVYSFNLTNRYFWKVWELRSDSTIMLEFKDDINTPSSNPLDLPVLPSTTPRSGFDNHSLKGPNDKSNCSLVSQPLAYMYTENKSRGFIGLILCHSYAMDWYR